MDRLSPRRFDLPHEEWRPNQFEAIRDIGGSGYVVNILDAPTGSGKTAIAKALGARSSVTSLTMTHMLQSQYVDLYDFTELKGSGNYPCEYNPMFMADMCAFLPSRYQCPVVKACAYVQQRYAYQGAKHRSLNYDYFALASWLREKQTAWLFADEAHRIPAWLSDLYSINMKRVDCSDLGIPHYPTTAITSNAVRLKLLARWLEKSLQNLSVAIEKLSRLMATTPKIIKKINHLQGYHRKFSDVLIGVEDNPEDWYCTWDDGRLKVVPLAVDKYFAPIFTDGFGHRITLASATIGNARTFAKSLGIERYFLRVIPPSFPVEDRKVYTYPDAPRMSHSSTALEKSKQADIIADSIKDLPSDWAGIIHVQSKRKTKELGDRLAKRGLQDRLYEPKGRTTADRLADIHKARATLVNPIVVDYGIGEGADLGEFKINIAADTPFPYIGDEVGRAKMEHDHQYYRWETAISIIQRAGRTRRGRPEDYGDENGFVAIADNSYHYVIDELSADFLGSLEDKK